MASFLWRVFQSLRVKLTAVEWVMLNVNLNVVRSQTRSPDQRDNKCRPLLRH